MISCPICPNSKNIPSLRLLKIVGKMQGKLFPNFKSTVEPRFNEMANTRDWGNYFCLFSNIEGFLYRTPRFDKFSKKQPKCLLHHGIIT